MDIQELTKIDERLATNWMGWVWSNEHGWVVDSERDADGRLTYCSPDELISDELLDEETFISYMWTPTISITQAFQVANNLPTGLKLRLYELDDGYWEAHIIQSVSLYSYDTALQTLGFSGEVGTPELAICLAIDSIKSNYK
jgi:hypothetical protein